MKSLIKTTLAIIAFSLVTTGSAFAEDAVAKTTVEALNNSWNKAFNNSDAGLLASLYAENAVLSPGNGKILNGRTEIENLFKSFFAAGLNNHKLEIVTVDGDDKTLYQVAKWSASGAEKDGVTATYGGITTSVYKRDVNGKWVARTHIWNAGN
ncbi:YybH family protein [Methylotenera sp. G11]|uniref:YybH family protein n=1 Tax=Methylotenera sp. G11 TaxID=1506585 RepID=UPI0006478C7F|nr:SgcJ/EcaC family oxidoreductase [Methylotenera sp. G11]